MSEIDHPSHYGGAGNPYEAIAVIEAWGLGFSGGNAVKYLLRAGKKGTHADGIVDLGKAIWYLRRAASSGERSDETTRMEPGDVAQAHGLDEARTEALISIYGGDYLHAAETLEKLRW